ncbi:CoA-binding protein, partial [uncultured Methanomethylovorans sp.]
MLDKLFDPDVIAVIGASRTEGKVGHAVLKNLLQGAGHKVIPINPNVTEILGLKCYADVLDVPEKIDLAVIVVPAAAVPSAMEKCGQAHISYVVVISAGFKEASLEGARLEREITAIAGKYGIRMVGPNCLGIIDTSSSLNASFAASMAFPGNIAMMSQSGAICTV